MAWSASGPTVTTRSRWWPHVTRLPGFCYLNKSCAACPVCVCRCNRRRHPTRGARVNLLALSSREDHASVLTLVRSFLVHCLRKISSLCACNWFDVAADALVHDRSRAPSTSSSDGASGCSCRSPTPTQAARGSAHGSNPLGGPYVPWALPR